HVHLHVARTSLKADDHPLVDGLSRLYEDGPALLRVGEAVGQGRSWRGCRQRPVALDAKLAGPGSEAVRDGGHDPGSGREGQEAVAEADQAARRNRVLEADAALPVVVDLDHGAPPS